MADINRILSLFSKAKSDRQLLEKNGGVSVLNIQTQCAAWALLTAIKYPHPLAI